MCKNCFCCSLACGPWFDYPKELNTKSSISIRTVACVIHTWYMYHRHGVYSMNAVYHSLNYRKSEVFSDSGCFEILYKLLHKLMSKVYFFKRRFLFFTIKIIKIIKIIKCKQKKIKKRMKNKELFFFSLFLLSKQKATLKEVFIWFIWIVWLS